MIHDILLQTARLHPFACLSQLALGLEKDGAISADDGAELDVPRR